MPVSIRRIASRGQAGLGVGITQVVMYTSPANTRTEIRELISDELGDANSHRWIENDIPGGFAGRITDLSINNAFEIINRQTLIEATDTLIIEVDVANSNPGNLFVSGVQYS